MEIAAVLSLQEDERVSMTKGRRRQATHQEGLFVHVPHMPVLFRHVLAWYFMIPKLFSHVAQKEHQCPLCIHVLVLWHLDDGCYLWREWTYRSSLLNYISIQIFPHSCYILPRCISAAFPAQIQSLEAHFFTAIQHYLSRMIGNT